MKLLETTKSCTKAVADSKKRRGRGTGEAEWSRRNCRAMLLWLPPPTRTMGEQEKMPPVSPRPGLTVAQQSFAHR